MDLDRMTGTIEALKGDPMLAQFQFRARNQWIDGGENRSTIKDFRGAGVQDSSRTKPFVSPTASRPSFLATTRAPIPWSSCSTHWLDA